MSERDLPYMPMWVKDWIAATMHWTDAERGAYVSLLFFQWVNGKVPPDVPQLGRIMGTPEKEFDARWAVVGTKFDGDVGGLFNNRLEEVRKEALRLRDAKVRAACAANAVRRAKKDALRAQSASKNGNAERDAHVTHPNPNLNLNLRDKNQDKEEEGECREGEGTAENSASRSANAVRASRGTFKNYWSDEKWIDFKFGGLGYPHRAGGDDDKGAQKAWRARLREGHTWDELFAGRDRYHRYCEAAGKIGTELVMMKKTFCGPSKRFLEDWEVPADFNPGETWSPPSDDPPEPT